MSGKKEKDPSQKFFTLIFKDGEEEKTTKVPAKKGKSLKETVESIISMHGFSLDSHSVFLEASNTPLPITSDTAIYGGNTLHIKAHEKLDKRIMNIMRSRKDSSNMMENANKRFSDLLLNFGSESVSPVADENSDCVDGTEDADSVFARAESEDEFHVEAHWSDIIQENDEMASRLKMQQHAIWELFTTESGFLKDVRVILTVFQECFRALQKEGYLTEVKESLLFANIEEVYDVNVAFWKSLNEIIKETRETKTPILPSQLLPAFEGFETLFQPYIEFCNADTSSMNLPDYQPMTSEKLKQYIAWCDNHEQCKRITIAGFLIKPLQRVTKYSLLLKAISNKTDDEVEKEISEDIRSRVETFVSEINSAIHLRQEQEKLDNVVMRISDYSPCEPINDEVERIVREYCNLNFRGNMPGLSDDEKRFIIKEGPMKIIDKHGKKEMYVFLFSDVLAITKLKRNIDKYRITRQPYRLNKIVLRDLKEPGHFLLIYLNEYGVAANAFICQVDLNEVEKWKTEIEKAKKSYEKVRTDFGFSDEFWDDDLPNSSVSKNKVLRRQAALRKMKQQKSISQTSSTSSITEDVNIEGKNDKMAYEWDFNLVMVALGIFFVANVVVSRIISNW